MLDRKEIDYYTKKCIHCGFCKAGCPMYMIYKEEKWSARGIVFLAREIFNGQFNLKEWGILEVIYACTLCGNCLTRCPARVNTPKIVMMLRNLSLIHI